VAHFPALPAPSHPTDLLTPFSTGSTSDLFRAIVKRPNPISLEINGELHSNAADVAIQFAAELRVYRQIGKHPGFVAYLGCVEGLGMVLEWVEGPTLLDVLRGPAPANSKAVLPPHKNPSKKRRITWYNQLVDALVHLHSLGLNHGDLSLLNIHVETRSDCIKLIDFGRSISVVGYPCQNIYLPDPDPPTPTVRAEQKLAPPPVFRPGGAWVEDDMRPGRTGRDRPGVRSSSHGRDGVRPKLFDRSTGPSSRGGPPSASQEDGVGMLTGDLSRPINHASRLLHPPVTASTLGTHMPITMSRANRLSRETQNISRPSSTSPVHTRFHLASSPMSPRVPYEEEAYMDNGRYEQDEWMQVDSYGAPLSASSTPSREYYAREPTRHDLQSGHAAYSSSHTLHGYSHQDPHLDPGYYAQSPPHSHPSSRRPSRSPGRYATPAQYANAPRSAYHHHQQHRSRSGSRHISRSPPPSHHRAHRITPQNDGYGEYPEHCTDQYPQSNRERGRGPRPPQRMPQKPPPKPEQIHPGSRPFCAPEILRAPSGSSIDSKTKQWIDPILADAYSLGIIMVCMDLCKLVDIGNEKQKREE
jgi:serine/threonine protein kinase